MKQQYSILYFISSFFLILTTTTFAQNILTLEDSLLFMQAAEFEKDYQVFEQKNKLIPLDRTSTCIKAAIYLKQGRFNKAFNLINTYPSYLKDDIKAFHLNYFTALVTLAQGNKNDAFKRLKAIHAQSKYKANAEKLLAHFFKIEEE
jgi:hypothetical protein